MINLRALFAILLVSSCASQASQDNMARAQMSCSQGDLQACDDIPYIQHVMDDEIRATTALALLPLTILIATHR